MQQLNLPAFEYNIEEKAGQLHIFDIIRKKYVSLTPEEWVRQHFLHYLINQQKFPKGLISLEKGTTYNRLQKRTDLCVYGHEGKPMILIECKAVSVPINQQVVKQVSTYNQSIRAPYLVITNGIDHFCWKVSFEEKIFTPLQKIPSFAEIQADF